MMHLHEAIAREIEGAGFDTLFGLIGDGNLFFVQSFQRVVGGTYVGLTHEANAIAAANAYSKRSGRPGIATVTHGPGLTNAITMLVEAVRGRSPLVVIVGDTPEDDANHLQKIPQRPLIAATGAEFIRAGSPETALHDLERAIRKAVLARTTVVFDVPSDFMWKDIEYRPVALRLPVDTAAPASTRSIEAAAGLILSSRRPIILVGSGATGDGARDAILALSQRIGAPLATTLPARELFRGVPHALGIFGTLSTEPALQTILESDCIIAFGAGLNARTTARGSLLAGKRVIHCDIDIERIGEGADVDVALHGDAGLSAIALVELIDEASGSASGFINVAVARMAAYHPDEFDDRSGNGTVDMRAALTAIDRGLSADRTLVVDAGRSALAAWERIRLPHPRATFYSVNFGAIGQGMGSAIGAAFAAPASTTLLVSGDGSLMIGGLAEFATAVRLSLDLVVVVQNDGGYGSEHIQFDSRDLPVDLALFEWPDFAEVARAMGGDGITVTDPSQLEEVTNLVASRERNRPLLVNVHIDVDLANELYGSKTKK